MNVPNFQLNSEEFYTIHSSSNYPLNISKNSTRVSFDMKNQMMIKGIYKKPKPSNNVSNINLTIYQGSLGSNEKSLINHSNKRMKTEENNPSNNDKFPFQIRINELVKKKKNISILTKVEENLRFSPKKPDSCLKIDTNPEIFNSINYKRNRILSCDAKKLLIPVETKVKKEEKNQFFLNTAYIPKKNWFAYPPKTSIIKQKTFFANSNNSSFIQKNVNSPNTLTNSIASSPIKKRLSLGISNFQKQKKTLKKVESKENIRSHQNLASPKISRLFEPNFVENLNNIIANSEIPLPPLSLVIKQSNLKDEETPQKVLAITQNEHIELNLLVNAIQTKYRKMLQEEQFYKEITNDEVDNFTRVGDAYVTEGELNTLVLEYARFDEKDIEKIDKITKRIKFFAKFQKPIRYRLLKISNLINKSANEILFKQGDFGDFLYVVIKGSVNVIVNSRNKLGEFKETVVASLYDGSHFGELAMMGANRNTKELKIDVISQIMTKNDIKRFVKNEADEKALEEKQVLLKEAQEINKRYNNKRKVIEKLENEIKEAVEAKIKEGQKRLATIKTQESSYFLVIPRNEFKIILLSLYQSDFEFKLKVLKKIYFFKDCDSASLIPFASYLSIQKFKMGEVIIREGDKITQFFIIGEGRCSAVKEVSVERVIKPSNFTRRMNDPLKNFNFGLQEYSPKENYSMSIIREKGEQEDLDLSLKLFSLQIQEYEEDSKIKYLEFIEYKRLLEGDFIGGRSLLALDPVLSKTYRNENAKLTVIAESNDVTLFSLPSSFITFVPDYIKKILIRNLAVSKEFDDFEIMKDVNHFNHWTKVKLNKCKGIIEKMGKERVGTQFYKKY